MDQISGEPQNVVDNLPAAVAIASTTNSTPIVVTTGTNHGIQTGDFVMVYGAQDPGAHGIWRAGTVTTTTVVLEGTTGTLVGGAQGTIANLGFGVTFAIPTDLVDDRDAGSVNVAFEALADRTAYNSYRLHGRQQATTTLSGVGPHTYTFDGLLGNSKRIIMSSSGAEATFNFTNLIPGSQITIVLSHGTTSPSVVTPPLTWGTANRVLHSFPDEDGVDGQPRPTAGTTTWIGTVHFIDGGDGGLKTLVAWTSRLHNVIPGSLRHRWAENTNAQVDAAGNFVVTRMATINQSIPSGGGTLFDVWTTPDGPYVIEGAAIELTGDCSSSVAQVTGVTFTLEAQGQVFVGGSTLGWGGTSYDVDGANTRIFAEPGDLLDGTFADGSGNLGARTANGQFLALYDGNVTSFWNTNVSLRVNPGTTATLTIPYRIRIWGRLLS